MGPAAPRLSAPSQARELTHVKHNTFVLHTEARSRSLCETRLTKTQLSVRTGTIASTVSHGRKRYVIIGMSSSIKG